MIKLRAPDDISSIVHEGVEILIADDRSVEVDDHSVSVFKAHGFRPWNDGKSAVPIDVMTHSQMVLHVLERTRRTLEVLPTEELRDRLLATTPDTVILPDDTETDGEQEQDISVLSRRALFALLRSKGVSISLPVTNEELRAAARHALGG
jgi:hypothetical protein